mgnify:CR=1 FL=1
MIKTDPSSIWDELKRGIEYQNAIGLTTQVPEYVRFKEGDQWPPSTQLTKHAAKPVINQCDFTIETRKSNILSTTIKMVFEPEELPEGQDNEELQAAAQDMNDMAQNTWNDIDEEEDTSEFLQRHVPLHSQKLTCSDKIVQLARKTTWRSAHRYGMNDPTTHPMTHS